MRILFVIPHYYNPEGDRRWGSGRQPAEIRAGALRACISSLHQHFGPKQGMIHVARKTVEPANQEAWHDITVAVFTDSRNHLLDRLGLPRNSYEAHTVEGDPKMLGFAAEAHLGSRLGHHDYYCFLEDDLVISDPWFFTKLRLFDRRAGRDCLLQPHRYELDMAAAVQKVYIDGPLRPDLTAPFQDPSIDPEIRASVMGRRLVFQRPLNPHTGCYFLTADQMAHWTAQETFNNRDTSFVSPLDSAATLGIMRTFKIYKTARSCAGFLELEHRSRAFIGMIPRESGNAGP